MVRHVSDRVAVMYLGKLAEVAPAAELYRRPRHPYVAALLSAVPVADPDLADRRERIILAGDPPSPIHPPAGCRFHPRCPKARARCVDEAPPLVPRGGDGVSHPTACHFPAQPRCSGEAPPLVPRGDGPEHPTACHFPVEPGEDLARVAGSAA